MRKLTYSIILAVSAFMVSCSKSDDFSVTFERVGYYFKWGQDPRTSYFTTDRVAKMEIKSVSDGWDCTLDFDNRFIIITAPEDPGSEEEREEIREGTASFTVTSNSGGTATYTINFTILDEKNNVDLSDKGTKCANCYIATQHSTLYTMCVTKDGIGQSLASEVVSVDVLWQSRSTLIEDLVLEDDGTVTFYVGRDIDDDGNYLKDDDGNFLVKAGNAVIGGYDILGNVVWSWHIWLVHKCDDPLANVSEYANGKTFMDFNLGSFGNSKGEDDDDKILDSYGLYYQWGRKDPFLRPMYYRCEYGSDEFVYNSEGSAVYIEFEEVNEDCTVQYAIQNPMTFYINPESVTSETDKSCDWLYVHDNTLWKDAIKTAYDPCPYGWRVPASNDFDILSLTAEEDAMDLDKARLQFGWNLSDGTKTHFYLGAGFHSYYDGVLRNMNQTSFPNTPEPWEGYYWTTGTKDNYSQCMYFDLTTTRAFNKFNLHHSSKRANALQIRCVKVK